MAECKDDVPPPLEDMTEQLKRFNKRSKVKPRPNLQHSSSADFTSHNKVPKNAPSLNNARTESGFGGFKKGFLFNSAVTSSDDVSKTTAITAVAVDDVIRPKVSGQSKQSSLEFPEVQEAMKESFPFLNTESWLTDNLLDKIEKDPVLSKAFQDPAMTEVLSQFQANPQQALAAARDKPEIQKILQSFCAMMGEHFSALGEAEEKKISCPVSEIMSQDEVLMKELLAKPEVKTVLEDPLIQKLIEMLKSNPVAAQQLLHSMSPDLKLKVKVLIDHGLLAMQQ